MSDEKTPCDGDYAIVGAQLPDGTFPILHHTPDHQVAVGTVKPLKEGENAAGSDLVQLKPNEDGTYALEYLYRTTKHGVEAGTTEVKGPAKVNNRAFRSGWDGIWGKNPDKETLPN